MLVMRKIKRGITKAFRRFDRGILRGFQRFFRLTYKLKPLRPLLRPMYKFVHVHYRLTASLLTILMIASIAIPVLQRHYTNQKYVLNTQARALLGEADTDLSKKLTFDAQSQVYEFNKTAKTKLKPNENPMAKLKSQIGGAGKNDQQLYSMDAPRDLTKGVTYYENQMNLKFKIMPQFATLPAEVKEGHIIYPLAGNSGQVAYTIEATGLKQNVVLYESPGDALNMSYKLDLPKSLEARLDDETGDIDIYTVDPQLLASIDYNSETAQSDVERIQTESPKTFQVFKIPAPVVMAQGKVDQASVGNIKSHFLLQEDVLTVMTTGLDKAEYPLAIDPTVSVDSASEFGSGSIEDNNLTLTSGDVTRGGLTGGSVPSWSSTTSFPTTRYFHRSVTYNGYVYVVAGNNASSDIRYAPINSDGTISPGTWGGTAGIMPGGGGYLSFGLAAYNGYMYIAGGCCSVSSLVHYAPINSNGSLGSWVATTSLPETKNAVGFAAYKGYLYAIGGYNGSTVDTDAFMVPVKADGSLGTWTTTTAFPSTARYNQQAVAYNDYMYILGGATLSDTPSNEVHYAPINTDGTLGTWQAATSFTTARWDHSAFAYNGYIYILGGRTGGSNAATNTVQYASINANGSLGTWTATTAFNTARYGQTAVAYNGYLYVLGGAASGTTTARDDVQYAQLSPPGSVAGTSFSTASNAFTNTRYAFGSVAYNGNMYVIGGVNAPGGTDVRYRPIQSDGNITGAWTSANAMNVGRQWTHAVAYNGYIYVPGGVSGGVPVNTTSYVPINSNGSLGTWANVANNFSNARDSSGVVAYNGYLYVLGGYSGTGNTTYNDVQYAPIQSNGNLGTWQSANSFSTTRSDLRAVAYNGYMYVMGGGQTNDGTNLLNDVQYAPINTNGSLGTWQSTNSFTEARDGHAAAVHNGVMYVVGGRNIGGTTLSSIQYAPIKSDGTVGTWTATTSFTQARRFPELLTYNGYLYVLGGANSSNTATNTVYYAPLNNGGPGTTGTWTSTSSFTNTRYGHGSVAYNGYMYILGGFNGSSYNDIQYAPISKSTGALSSWSSAGSNFTTARYGLDVFVYNGYIYVLGGTTNGSSYLNDVQYAPINSDGTIGSWSTTTSFPTARYGHHVVVYNGYIYLTGGNDGSARNDVQYAPINTNGSIGTWASAGTFTNARYGHDATINNGYIYIMAGNDNGTYYNDVQMAQIQGDGSLGSWTTLTPFNNPRYGIDSFVYNGYLYVVGGYNGVSYYNDVQYAPIAPNGHVGAWQATTTFTTARYVHTALAYNGYMYVLGGNSGSYLNNVYYAPMSIMSRKATYSKVLNFGTNSKITGVSYTGNLIDGLQNIRYRFANSAGTFPTTAPRGADLPFTCDSGSHIQVLATLDNTTSSVFPDSSGTPGQINSITVTYDIPGVAPEKRLRHGAYFSSEELQPFELNGC